MINRQIIAVADNGFRSDPARTELYQHLLDLTQKPSPRVCLIPTASGDAADYIEAFQKLFRELGAKVSVLSLFRGEEPDFEKLILNQDLIYVTGGNTLNLLLLWKHWGIDLILRRAYDQGIILAGGSAGSLCWFESGVTDSLPGRFSSLNALGFLKGSNCPHYNELTRRPYYLAAVTKKELPAGFAAENGVALHFINEKFSTALTAYPNRHAYHVKIESKLGPGLEQAFEEEIPVQTLPAKNKTISTARKGSLHPRNLHQERYDFAKLKAHSPELGQHLRVNEHGDVSLDFTRPESVQALNRALLRKYYSIQEWEIPPGNLCPPIPGRADYLHYLRDLVGEVKPNARILDIGVGANCIYPILGHRIYNWAFIGSEINPLSLANAEKIVKANHLEEAIELRLQNNPQNIFRGIVQYGDEIAASLCNPPFHRSAEEAAATAQKKWSKLGKLHEKKSVNFGGVHSELWCEGGEVEFLRQMIEESSEFRNQVGVFTSLVSKAESLGQLENFARKAKVRSTAVINMEQGQKKSRLFAWSFQKSLS